MSLMTLPNPEWIELLKAEAAKGKPIAQIAREVGMKRPSVSMLINGTYPARSLDLVTRKHGAAVMRLYRDQMMCPHLNRGISVEECHRFASAPMSTSSPEKLRHWAACRRCSINPTKQDDPNGQAI